MAVEFTCRYAQPTPESERERLTQNAGFGEYFTDHMITAQWTAERDWHNAQLQPYAPLCLDPAAQVFHYGQEVFEGLKAYRRADGGISTFRPLANARRLNRSCQRMAMPALPEDTFLEAIDLLVKTDRAWVPNAEGHSLYLRPFVVATQPGLSFYRRSREFLFVVIASPAGAYFKGGVRPISVWIQTEYIRAAPGGTGEAKCGGNYAGTLLAQEQAAEMGCEQVVWLDAAERRWVEEMGTSNLFFVFGSRLVTPKLSGTVLPGITRDSLLRLAVDLGYEVCEDRVSVEQWRAAAAAGQLTEVFSCGTSSMVTPVGSVKSMEDEFAIGDGQPGPVTMRLREELLGIQFGQRPDPYGWSHRVI
jgi:branched-chain amino acid aminotransferase